MLETHLGSSFLNHESAPRIILINTGSFNHLVM